MRATAEVRELNHYSLLDGQLVHRFTDLSNKRRALGRILRLGSGEHDSLLLVEAMMKRFALRPPCLGANGIDRPSVRLHSEEGAKRSSRGVEAFWSPPQLDKDVLGDVLGEGGAGRDPTCKPVDEGTVTIERLAERVVISGDQASAKERVRVHVVRIEQLPAPRSDELDASFTPAVIRARQR